LTKKRTDPKATANYINIENPKKSYKRS